MKRVEPLCILTLAVLVIAAGASAFPGPGQEYFVKEDLGTLAGDTYSYAQGINSSRTITGQSGFTRAFLWTPPGPMVELDPSTDAYRGNDINDAGEVAGDGFGYIYVYDAFLWTAPGPAVGLDGPPGILFDQYAYGMNESGDVVGAWEDPPSRPAFWPGGGYGVDLGTLGGNGGYASEINEGGGVVGQADLPGNAVQHAFYWTDGGGMIDLSAGVATSTAARGLNDNNQIVGWITSAGAERAAFWPAPGQASVNLGTIGGGGNSRANSISNGGTIVGRTTIAPANPNRQAFRKKTGGSMQKFGTLGGPESEANDISSEGHIVGEADLANGDTHAVVWWRYTVPYDYSCQCQGTPPPWPPGFFDVYLSSTVDVDARRIDPRTVTLGDSEDDDDVHVAVNPLNGEPLARLVDVTGDGNIDLVVEFSEEELRREGEWTPETTEFWIQGAMYDRASGVEGIVQVDPTGTPGAPDAAGSVRDVALLAPSPNPVTREATLVFELPRAGDAVLAIYDTSGRSVATLASGPHGAGRHIASWDRRDAQGRLVSAGVYVARLRALGSEQATKVIVVD